MPKPNRARASAGCVCVCGGGGGVGAGAVVEDRAFSALSGLTKNFMQIKVKKIRGGAFKRISKWSG